jgi:predicted nucleic acid-binding protein
MAATYLDSSAIVKLVIEEPESLALRSYLRRRRPLISSALARTEVQRALMFEGAEGLARGRAVLERLDLIRLNDRLLDAAGTISRVNLRSLDALHLATAQSLGIDVSQLVTYDERMIDAARDVGVRTASPK